MPTPTCRCMCTDSDLHVHVHVCISTKWACCRCTCTCIYVQVSYRVILRVVKAGCHPVVELCTLCLHDSENNRYSLSARIMRE